MTPTVLICLNSPYPFWQFANQHAERLRAGFPDVRFQSVTEADVVRHIADASGYFGWAFDPRWLEAARSLEWAATPSAGVDHWPVDGLTAAHVVLTRGYGYHGQPMTEHALGLLLGFSRGLFQSNRLQTTSTWWKDELAGTFFDLAGQTLTIVGCGSIGGHLARAAQALGMHVIGVRRTPATLSAQKVEWVPSSNVRKALARSRAVINLLPTAEDTFHYFDRSVFASFRPGSVFINLGRASTVEHEALLDALSTGTLSGAALDVLPTKPPALDDPLRHHPRIVLTPKCATFSHTYMDQAVEFFCENLRLFLSGQPLNGVVNTSIGGPHVH
ncbi:D-2-hydroxyacid dehydrogenase [Streptomyces sp. NPDC059101]|uniref:D-2-hydroxyacid dehydrogenase n=1 Tax=unclassified Streptomyces TaxID=2593676 RepID=UPI003678BFDB